MATFTATQSALPVSRERSVLRKDSSSVFGLVLTYGLLFPMVFFAARGSFSFEYMSLNTPAEGQYGALVNSNFGQGSAAHSIEMVACYGLICLAMAVIWKPLLDVCTRNWFYLIMPLWAMASAAWSQDPKRSFVFAVQTMILTAFSIYLAVRLKPKQQMQFFIFVGLVVTLFSFAIAAVLPRAGIDHKNAMIGVEGIFPHKNVCSVVMISFMLPAFFYKFPGKLGNMKRIAYLAITGLLVLATTSRTGWLVLLCCIACAITLRAMRHMTPLQKLLVSFLLVGLIALIIWIATVYFRQIVVAMGKDPSMSGRTQIWKAVFLSIFKRPMLGYGYDAFWMGFKGESMHLALASGFPGLGNAENGILELWLEVGFVGVLLQFIALGMASRSAMRSLKADTPPHVLWYMSMLFITLLAIVDGDKFMLPHSIEWVMFVMAGVGLAEHVRTNGRRQLA
ncbi:O-antigen ligase family protein [Silvibacterium sp.]|uniref:O-antigen ligase family protein n=1 Tax=Silvibacterium sp. TaxID=1964179 RepID=UPI0039E2CC63